MEGPTDPEAARRASADALRLCLAGNESAGMAQYRSVAEVGETIAALPLGFHVHMLRGAGRSEAAEALAALTLDMGGDLAWKSRVGDVPAVAAAEYEEFFAHGLANALMVNRYIAALTALGRTEEVAAIFDPERLLRTVRIEGSDVAAKALLEREAGLEPGSRMSVRQMTQVQKLQHFPEFAPLLAACRNAVDTYLARWASSDHPLARLVPNAFTLGAWGLISRGEGYNTRHRHTIGWATGVYYPIGLDPAISGGSLCIGGWSDPAPPGWPVATIRPEPGLLVLMPSYYVHWTEPLGAPGLRLSIAFDAIPGV